MVENTFGVSLLDRGIHLNHQVAHITQHQIHHDVDMILIFVEIIEFGNAWMIQVLHDFSLAVNGVKFLWLKSLLFIDLDCHIFAGFFVECFVHVRLSTFVNHFLNAVLLSESHWWLNWLDHFDELILADRRRVKSLSVY